MKITVRHMAIIGVLLLFSGVATYFLNYEKQTINLSSQSSRQTILEYRAPGWDPFTHHVKITVDTQAPVTIRATFTGKTTKTETYSLQSGEELMAIHPEDTLRIQMENPQFTMGTIKTVLWCDSWNYSAGILAGTGIVLIIGSVIRFHRKRSS